MMQDKNVGVKGGVLIDSVKRDYDCVVDCDYVCC